MRPGVDLFDALSPERRRALLARMVDERKAGAVLGPLSEGQRALWFVQQLAPESSAYNVSFGARVPQGLDVDALRASLQALVDRHEALRTTFTSWDGIPLQRVHASQAVEFDVVDAQEWTDDEVREALAEEAHRPFDLERGPLLRSRLLTRRGGEHVFLLSVHHIVYDFVSLVVLLDEIRTLYPAARAGRQADLPPPSAQYSDYVRWQRAMMSSPQGERHWSYWRERLRPPLPTVELPTDRPRPPFETFRGAAHPFLVDEALTGRLKELARREGVTLYVLLLAAFQTLLHRYTGQEDLVVGSPLASRPSAEFSGAVGYFINPVVLRADCAGSPRFTEFLAQVRQTVLEALDHQAFPFAVLVERLQPERDPSRSALFQIMFNVPKAQRLEEQGLSRFLLGEADVLMELDGLRVELFPIEHRSAMFDLLLSMVDAGPALAASLHYNTDLFDADTSWQLAQHLGALLEAVVEDPTSRLRDLDLLTPSERARLRSVSAPPRPLRGMVERFDDWVERGPGAVAVAAGDEALSRAELRRRVDTVARRLEHAESARGRVVAVLMERGVDLLVTMLGIFEAGAIYLPLDPRDPAPRLARTLARSGAQLVVVGAGSRALLDAAASELPGGRPRILDVESLHAPAAGEPTSAGGPGAAAYVIFTSGSTGIPKGAIVEHRGMLNHLDAKLAELALTERDVVAQTAPQCFDISVWQYLAPLLVGGRVHVFDDELAHDPSRLLDAVAREGITVLEIVPSMLQALLDGEARREQRVPLPSLRWLISTGEELSPELCRRWLVRYPSIPLMNAYGPTECSDDVTHHVIREPPAANGRVPIGTPIANTSVLVLDRDLRPLPAGAVGEICVGGVAVGAGYLNDASRTAEAFVPDPFGAPGARLYRTGDLGRARPDGTLEYLGRIDAQVKVRGHRIELGEIEAALSEHRSVAEAAAAVRRSDAGEQFIAGYVVAHKPPLDTRELLAHARKRLPAYMVPGALVELAALPRTATGKLDRGALPAPSGATSSAALAVSPRTPTERLVAEIWRQVLGSEPSSVDEDFFESGGHSLQAAQVVAALREARGVDLPIRLFLEKRTIAGVAAALDEPLPDAAAAELPVVPEADTRLDPAIAVRRAAASAPSGRVLVTGATGFLGAFVVAELLAETSSEIACLVRARDEDDARVRLARTLGEYRLGSDEALERIRPVVGDMGAERLGLDPEAFAALARSVDAIYHSAAHVNFLLPYAALRATNVRGTHEVLRLACTGEAIPVHLVSTVSVLGNARRRVTEDDPLPDFASIDDGYSQSKWVAEALAAEARRRGAVVSVLRPGRITGHSGSGVGNPQDLVFQLVALCVRYGRAPALDVPVDLTPVDYVSRAIVHLSLAEPGVGPVHLANPAPAALAEVVEWLRSFGYGIEQVSLDEWLSWIAGREGDASNAALAPVLSFLADRLRHDGVPEIDCRRAVEKLAPAGIECPPVGERLVHRYLDHLVEAKLLPPPGLSAVRGHELAPSAGGQ
jgi:amino acid adenylation domain-containing protein/thioester reductase-like protein